MTDLFGNEKHRRDRYVGPTALEHVPADVCPDCGATTHLSTVAQPALLRHGGYGADHTSTVRACDDPDCRWSLLVDVTETRPLR